MSVSPRMTWCRVSAKREERADTSGQFCAKTSAWPAGILTAYWRGGVTVRRSSGLRSRIAFAGTSAASAMALSSVARCTTTSS